MLLGEISRIWKVRNTSGVLDTVVKRGLRIVVVTGIVASFLGGATSALADPVQESSPAAKPGDNQPFDTYEAAGGKRTPFDGDWKKQQLSEADYMKTFAAADAAYSEMLTALIAQAKK